MADDPNTSANEQHITPYLSRRAFLRRVALGLSAPALGAILSSCQAPFSASKQSAGTVDFAVIGDFGRAGTQEQEVADLVKSWQPDFIVTTGDNNYPDGLAETIDGNIGQYYADYIGNYRGSYGKGAAENRFWPVLGNHDWLAENAQPYLDYFTLPDKAYYYTFTEGPVQFFMLDSNKQTPDGADEESTQGQWLRLRLAESTAPWRVVMFHNAAYSSGENGPIERMRWPFSVWGADLVLAGHDHVYERFDINGTPYITNGLGGAEAYKKTRDAKNSKLFFNQEHGAMRVAATRKQMTLQFITHKNKVVDRINLMSKRA